jgi:hypothetical protein
MHVDDLNPQEMGRSEILRVAAMRIVISLYREELLMAAGFAPLDDPDRLLYDVVLEAERRHARDYGVDPRAIVLNEQFREKLLFVAAPSADEDVDLLIDKILTESERRWICLIIEADVYPHDEDEVVRRWRAPRDDDEDLAAGR